MADGYAGGILDREAQIGLSAYWKQQRFAYDGSGNIEYKGCHAVTGVGTADAHWTVWKYTWTGSNLTLIEGPLKGSWDNRATLDWV